MPIFYVFRDCVFAMGSPLIDNDFNREQDREFASFLFLYLLLSLLLQVQAVSASTSGLRQEVVRLKEELAAELARRQMAEEACQRLIAEKGNLSLNVKLVGLTPVFLASCFVH